MNEKPFEWQGEDRPAHSEKEYARLLGKTVLVGITYLDPLGKTESQDQFYGTVEKADGEGIVLSLKGRREGESWTMPPDLRSLSPAMAGEYRLRTTGEIVTDPDFTATWTVQKPVRH